MRNIITISSSVALGFCLALLVLRPGPVAVGGGGGNCSERNGDVNADGTLDLTDAITILGHLFLGSPSSLLPSCAPPGGAAGLPGTGQTVCWSFDGTEGLWVQAPCGETSCAGQDGDAAAGCPAEGRFIDNGDGTVSDTCTGLMWQQDTADVSGDGPIDPTADTLPWCEAVSYCEGLSFAGHDDWRLPNARELQSIVDYGRTDPAIDPIFGALSQYYWSSTTMLETPDNGWGVGFNNGYVGVRTKVGDFDFSFNFVRAVRNDS